MQHCSYLGHPLVLSKMSLWQMKSGLNFLADYQLIITSQRLRKVTSDLNQDLLFHSLPILNASTNVQCMDYLLSTTLKIYLLRNQVTSF